MAADCKSAGPRIYGGSNPPLCTRFYDECFPMNRLWLAMSAYAVLAILALTTIDDRKFKLATLAALAFFAIRTLTVSRKNDREERDGHDDE